MGTRGVIARVKGDGWEGRYHHWDSYPTELGKSLYTFAQQIGVKRLLEILVDEHPVGWSTINRHDITKEPGYIGHDRKAGMTWEEWGKWKSEQGPECYCHGDRQESEPLLIADQSDDCGTEWAYAISERANTMTVYERVYSPARWRFKATVRLDGAEPDWAAIEGGDDE